MGQGVKVRTLHRRVAAMRGEKNRKGKRQTASRRQRSRRYLRFSRLLIVGCTLSTPTPFHGAFSRAYALHSSISLVLSTRTYLLYICRIVILACDFALNPAESCHALIYIYMHVSVSLYVWKS